VLWKKLSLLKKDSLKLKKAIREKQCRLKERGKRTKYTSSDSSYNCFREVVRCYGFWGEGGSDVHRIPGGGERVLVYDERSTIGPEKRDRSKKLTGMVGRKKRQNQEKTGKRRVFSSEEK